MLAPTRPLPSVGSRARIVHFGGARESALVVAVREQGRRLDVRGEDGGLLEFVLNPSTAKFVPVAGSGGERLELLG